MVWYRGVNIRKFCWFLGFWMSWILVVVVIFLVLWVVISVVSCKVLLVRLKFSVVWFLDSGLMYCIGMYYGCFWVCWSLVLVIFMIMKFINLFCWCRVKFDNLFWCIIGVQVNVWIVGECLRICWVRIVNCLEFIFGMMVMVFLSVLRIFRWSRILCLNIVESWFILVWNFLLIVWDFLEYRVWFNMRLRLIFVISVIIVYYSLFDLVIGRLF